jgi:hypothetical protein
MSDFATFTANYERYRQTLIKANALNKAVIFEALAAAGITELTIDFDGEGDSGQIDGCGARAGDMPVTVPSTPITLHDVAWNSDQIQTVETTLPDAIASLCYAYLQQEHGGWENNDGAYGVFEFDIAARTVHLDFNARFTDVHHSRHTF